jgi:hypothetical protein
MRPPSDEGHQIVEKTESEPNPKPNHTNRQAYRQEMLRLRVDTWTRPPKRRLWYMKLYAYPQIPRIDTTTIDMIDIFDTFWMR